MKDNIIRPGDLVEVIDNEGCWVNGAYGGGIIRRDEHSPGFKAQGVAVSGEYSVVEFWDTIVDVYFLIGERHMARSCLRKIEGPPPEAEDAPVEKELTT